MPTGTGPTIWHLRRVEGAQEPMHTKFGVPGLSGSPTIPISVPALISTGVGGCSRSIFHHLLSGDDKEGPGGTIRVVWWNKWPLFQVVAPRLCSRGVHTTWLCSHPSPSKRVVGRGCIGLISSHFNTKNDAPAPVLHESHTQYWPTSQHCMCHSWASGGWGHHSPCRCRCRFWAFGGWERVDSLYPTIPDNI